MFEWLTFSWLELLIGVLLFVITVVVSLAAVTFILIKLPADYFRGPHGPPIWPHWSPTWRWLAHAGKNVLGVVLIIGGIVMSLPGVPGQGLLTILIGLMLLDFPGKRRLEQRFVRWPRIRSAIDRIRARFGKSPLVLDDDAAV